MILSAQDYDVTFGRFESGGIGAKINEVHKCSGFSDDEDAIMFPDAVDLYNVTEGINDISVSRTTISGGEVSFKFLPTSPSTVFFMRELALIKGNPSDPNDEGGIEILYDASLTSRKPTFRLPEFQLRQGVMKAAPYGQTVGMGSAANMVFTFYFRYIIPDYTEVGGLYVDQERLTDPRTAEQAREIEL